VVAAATACGDLIPAAATMVPAMEPPPGLAINSKNAIMVGVVPQVTTLGVTLVVLGVTIQEAIVEMEIP